MPGKIETGRWYDIRIELKGPRIRCYLDGKLIHDVAYPKLKTLFASASLSKDGRDVFVKVVNAGSDAQPTELKLDGIKTVSGASAIVLASENPEDENTLEQPLKVAPVTRKLECRGTTLEHTFPGNSVSVLRFKVR